MSCGNGYKEKILQCDDPKPEHGGKKCSCDTIYKDAELIQDHHFVMRKNIQDIFCNETTAIITKNCAMNPCPGNHIIILRPYKSENFSSIRQFYFHLNFRCILVNGGWNFDNNFTACTKSCGGGTKTKELHCVNPVPQYNGKNCSCSLNNQSLSNCNGLTAALDESCNNEICEGT